MFASEELKKERINICLKCPSMKKTILVGKTCGRFMFPTKKTCGCIIESKASLDFTSCPQGKW